MRRADKAARIARILDELFPAPGVPLAHGDPYQLLIAVVLSARCTDAIVNTVTPRLFGKAPDAAAMARLPLAQIERIVRPCGLWPQKARHIRALSKILCERHGGAVPMTFAELEALPGVGHKTASVVVSQAFGQPAFAIDTHIHRLAARWGLSTGASVARTERDLQRLFPRASWGKLHLQMISFGRAHCPARGHDPSACPICSWAASKRRIAAERSARRAQRGARAESDARSARSAAPVVVAVGDVRLVLERLARAERADRAVVEQAAAVGAGRAREARLRGREPSAQPAHEQDDRDGQEREGDQAAHRRMIPPFCGHRNPRGLTATAPRGHLTAIARPDRCSTANTRRTKA